MLKVIIPATRESSAADLKFLHHLQQARSGTSNRYAALESNTWLVTRFNLFEGFEILSGLQVPGGTGSVLETSAFGAKRTSVDPLSAKPGCDPKRT
jgi:hypothetical protein